MLERFRCFRQHGRRFIRPRVGRGCCAQKLEHRTVLLRSRLNDRSDWFASTAADSTSSALRNAAVDGDETDGLFRQVVGRFNVGFGDEPDAVVFVFVEPMGQVVRLSAEKRTPCCIPYGLAVGFRQGTLEFSGDASSSRRWAPLNDRRKSAKSN